MSTGAGLIVVAGFGTGVSKAVATKFASQGFKLALLSRTKSKLDAAAAEYAKNGVEAKGYAVDLSNSESVKETLASVRGELGPITIVFWNPYGSIKSFLEASEEDLVSEFKLDVAGLVAAVQATHPDLKAQAGKSAVLVTGGAAAVENEDVAQFIADVGWTTLATAKAAQRRLVHVMNKSLAKDDIYVAEVTIMVPVKGTPFESGPNVVTAEYVADLLWETYTKRDLTTWAVPATPSA